MTSRALLAATLVLVAAAALPTAAPAATAHLSPTAYATLVRIHAAADAPTTDAEVAAAAEHPERICLPAPDASADQQTRWVFDDCMAAVSRIHAIFGLIPCASMSKKRGYPCLAKALHVQARATRAQLAVEQRLADSVTGDCRAYFLVNHATFVASAKAQDRYADALLSGNRARIAREAKRFGKATEPDPTAERRATRLMPACDPGVPAPA